MSLCVVAVGDFEKIWREHCEDEQTLSEYALAMKNLADNHWAVSEGEGRIEWCRRYGSKLNQQTDAKCLSDFVPRPQCVSGILFGRRDEKDVGEG